MSGESLFPHYEQCLSFCCAAAAASPSFGHRAVLGNCVCPGILPQSLLGYRAITAVAQSVLVPRLGED